jgi:hypothetical protein
MATITNQSAHKKFNGRMLEKAANPVVVGFTAFSRGDH